MTALVVTGVVSAAGGSTNALTPVGELASGGPTPLGAQRGSVTASVKLTDASVAVATAKGNLSKDQQKQYAKQLKDKQAAVAAQVQSLGGKQVASVTTALNAIVVSVDRAKIPAIEKLDGVDSVRIVRDYELDLSETVPYVGGAALQALGKDGTGVTVAVLDSGIDYTHRSFGGAGTAAAYTAAYGANINDPKTTTTDGLFPTAKVIGGFDFVGEGWPTTARTEDPDPIDCGPAAIAAPCAGGHGSHVADIVAGIGPSKGMAPGAKLRLYKVCSARATSCNGVALLLAVDAAMDPNGDGSIDDHADVINLSLGNSYGQDEDDLTLALNNASEGGAIVVASAGNSANKPYVTGSPSSGENVISVAQTQVPSAVSYGLRINSPPSIAGLYPNTETVGWAPITTGFTGDVAFVGRGCPAGSVPGQAGADAYLADPAGKVALIDRGACAVSLKVDRAAKAGAIGVLIAMVDANDPVSFSFGGGDTFVQTLIIRRAERRLITGVLPVLANVTVGPSSATPMVGSVVGSSSRGPSYSRNSIKPDVGAPGASVSAEAGTGTGATAFGGTSGAAPMVSGAAALLRQAYPTRAPFEIKSLLMNTAATEIFTNPALSPGLLAPITRIGGGEIRVKVAYDSTTAAWDEKQLAGSLSFGYVAAAKTKHLSRTVVVRNYSASPITYSISQAFRYASDASGAVSFQMPSSIAVGANGTGSFKVEMTIDPSMLPIWTMNGGFDGGNGPLLNGHEFDGYITLDGGTSSKKVHLAWQVLPHRSADVSAKKAGASSVELKNKSSVLDGGVEVFSLTGTSDRIKKKLLPRAGDNFAIIDMKSVGIRMLSGGLVQFAVDTYGVRSHPNYPAEFDWYVDSNNDGNTDYIVFNAENGGFAITGQNLTWFVRCTAPAPDTCATTGAASAFFFTDADLDSGNAIFTVPMASIGLTSTQQFNVSVYAFDNYFTGALTDAVENMRYTLGAPRFAAAGPESFSVPADGSANVAYSSPAGGATASPSQSGLLFLYRDAEASGRNDPGKDEADAVNLAGK